jgi:hypothetical protein
MVSCVRFPFLSGLPAIFHVFFAVATSFPQTGHLAIGYSSGSWLRMYVHKTLSIHGQKNKKITLKNASFPCISKKSMVK